MDSPTPTAVNEVLEEAAVISVIEDPSNQDELIERFQKILNKSIQTKANAKLYFHLGPPKTKQKTSTTPFIPNTQTNNRLEGYLEVARESQDDESITTLARSITLIADNILATNPEDDILDGVYELVEDLESVLLCVIECGDLPIEIMVFFFLFFFFVTNETD